MKASHLITVDELRAAGALDVPPAWRKRLGREPRTLFDLFGDDDKLQDKQPPAPEESDGDESTAELA